MIVCSWKNKKKQMIVCRSIWTAIYKFHVLVIGSWQHNDLLNTPVDFSNIRTEDTTSSDLWDGPNFYSTVQIRNGYIVNVSFSSDWNKFELFAMEWILQDPQLLRGLILPFNSQQSAPSNILNSLCRVERTNIFLWDDVIRIK